MSCCYCLPNILCVPEGEQRLLKGCTEYKTVDGPTVSCIGPCWSSDTRMAITLSKTEYVKIEDELTGDYKVIKGPALYFKGAHEKEYKNQGKSAAKQLGPTDYLIISDEQTGNLAQVRGPLLWFPGPFDKIERDLTAVPLQHNQYMKIVDTETGIIRVEKGEDLIYLEPTESILNVRQNDNGVKEAVNIDEHTAVLIRNTKTGQLRLEMRQQLLIPSNVEEIEKVQKKVTLEDHESVILKDKEGRFHFKHGCENPDAPHAVVTASSTPAPSAKKKKGKKGSKDAKENMFQNEDDLIREMLENEYQRAFFIPPYCEIVSLQWSKGIKKDKYEKITRIDRRPAYMDYEFLCRTCDNVELILDITFFWQVVDVQVMIEHTEDPRGDICNHARSIIIQEVSQTTLEKFMAGFNKIIQRALLETGDSFYEDRGCIVHTVEVRSYHCKDPGTEKTLQEIIKETTDRLNRLQKVQSENEVKLYEMKGNIEEEKLHGDLLKIRHSHHRVEAAMEGEAEADQIRKFMEGLPDLDQATVIAMWNTLRKIDSLHAVSQGNSRMYFTPNDVNLSIETFENPALDGPPKSKNQAKAKRYDFNKFTNQKEEAE